MKYILSIAIVLLTVFMTLGVNSSEDVNTDVNGDGVVNILDLVRVVSFFGQLVSAENTVVDVNGDGEINILDLVRVAQDIGASQDWTVLGLRSDLRTQDRLVPVNDISEWNARYEQMPGEIQYEYVDGEWSRRKHKIRLRFENDFQHWIYLHANGKVVYDLHNKAYSKFSGSIGIPTFGCEHGGSIQFLFYLDGNPVWVSNIIVGLVHEAFIPIEFDIPENAQKLTIVVEDAGDGIECDHAIIGNPRLLHR